jgi:hypothetical protein
MAPERAGERFLAENCRCRWAAASYSDTECVDPSKYKAVPLPNRPMHLRTHLCRSWDHPNGVA